MLKRLFTKLVRLFSYNYTYIEYYFKDTPNKLSPELRKEIYELHKHAMEVHDKIFKEIDKHA